MSDENPDGIRRVESLLKNIKDTAEQALAIALSNSIAGQEFILSLERGGTGSATKIFVDTFSNQFEIDGFKIFRTSIAFQHEADIVDSGELAGNIRLVSCDPPGADVGPQMRFSGRSSSADHSPFAFGTIAGRKENNIDGDRSGYLQFASTDVDGHIVEHARLDSDGTFGFGTTIPIKGLGNRIQVSGGDIFVDNDGDTRSLKFQIGEALGRVQALRGLDGGDTEHIILSANVGFAAGSDVSNLLCLLDAATSLGSAAVDVKADGSSTNPGGFVRFWTGLPGECPSVRGFFSNNGLDVLGNAVVTHNIIAGGLENISGGLGNHTVEPDGFVTGDNVKYGPGSPEGVVFGPIGAIYGRNSGNPSGSDAPDENTALWVKVFNEGENTGWLPIPAGGANVFCAHSGCPDVSSNSDGSETVSDCKVWFDTERKILFYFDSDVVRSNDPLKRGAWLSAQTFQVNIPITGRSHTQQFRSQIDKDYEYITPLHFSRHKANMFLVDLTAALRVARNSSDPVFALNNYYTFDLVALERRQGDPSANRATRQEWPGDRDSYEVKRDNLRADGHTTFPDLSDDLVKLSSFTPNGPPVDGVGTVTNASSSRRVLIDASKTWISGQWRERENNDTHNGLPANNGFRVVMRTGVLAGQERTIHDNTSDTLILRRPWRKVILPDTTVVRTPQVNDQYDILDSQHRKIIARISTKGNVFPDGAHVNPTGDRSADPPPLFSEVSEDDNGNLLTRSQVVRNGQYVTRDVQDFVTTINNGLDANNPGGVELAGTDSGLDPDAQHLELDTYVDIEGYDGDPDDAVVLAGLWDSVRHPGRISGVISVTYRLALPPDCGANASSGTNG